MAIGPYDLFASPPCDADSQPNSYFASLVRCVREALDAGEDLSLLRNPRCRGGSVLDTLILRACDAAATSVWLECLGVIEELLAQGVPSVVRLQWQDVDPSQTRSIKPIRAALGAGRGTELRGMRELESGKTLLDAVLQAHSESDVGWHRERSQVVRMLGGHEVPAKHLDFGGGRGVAPAPNEPVYVLRIAGRLQELWPRVHQGPELEAVRDSLVDAGHSACLPSGSAIFVRPEQHAAAKRATDRLSLTSHHVVVSESLYPRVLEAVVGLALHQLPREEEHASAKSWAARPGDLLLPERKIRSIPSPLALGEPPALQLPPAVV